MSISDSLKKIVFITGQLGLGGAEKQLYLLTRSLVQRGWHVTVITLNGGVGDFWEGPIRDVGVSLLSIPAGSSKASRVMMLRNMLARIQPSIVHSWTIYANIYAALAGRLARIKFRIGSERANHHSSRQDIGAFWYAQSLRGLDALVTNSAPAAIYLREYRPRLKTFVVPNAVEIPPPVGPQAKRALRGELNIPDRALVVGSIGRMVPRKGFQRLIQCASLLAPKWSALHVALIGDGPIRDDLYEQAVKALGPERVHFHGAKPDAARYCPAFDVFCFPSDDQEGMPNVLMEASSYGIPAVATNVGSVAEVVEHGVTGFVTEINGAREMSASIERLLAEPALRETMGIAARQKVSKEFGVDAMVSRMERVYEEILCGS